LLSSYLIIRTSTSNDKTVLEGLSSLAKLELQSLNLADTKVTNKALIVLAKFQHLQSLDLSRTQVTSDGLKALAELPSLHTLGLGEVSMTDEGLKALSELRNLQSLNLYSLGELAAPTKQQLATWTAEGLKALAKLKRLQKLNLIRDLFNPFRPLTLDPAWLTWKGTVPKLAQGIYDEGAFDRLPILADALEEAGCADQSLLSHCGQPSSHGRGCWLVDCVLGKG
jgi:hypothetical protein